MFALPTYIDRRAHCQPYNMLQHIAPSIVFIPVFHFCGWIKDGVLVMWSNYFGL
jgi:hypothetical protein